MAHEEMVGQVLGHYKILRPLGYGGMATVFLAEDIHLQRQVAIKLFQAEEDEKAEFLRRFAREARVLARLDHPNILPIYDYGEQNEHAYLVIPYMPGGSLRDFLQQHRPVEVQQTVHLISQVLQGLQYAHEQGLIHRDIKPGNMLFKANGTLLLADFGLVKVMTGPDSLASIVAFQDSNSFATHTITGTPDYMAPEQILGQATQSSDIYAIGIVLYEMLTGSRPLSADNYLGVLMKHLHEQPEPLRARNPTISPAIEAVVMRALEKDTNKRYQHAKDLQQALQLAQEITDRDPGLRLTEPTVTSSWPFPLSEETEETPAYLQQPQANIQQKRKDRATTPQNQEHATLPVTPSEVVPNRVWPERGPVEQQLVQQNNFQQSYPSSTAEAKKRTLLPAILLAIILILLISLGSLLYATGIFPAHPGKPTPVVQGIGQNSTTTSIANTLPITSTACPTAGSARAALITSIVTGNQANVIYIVNDYAGNQPTFGTLKRRVATAVTTTGIEIIKMPNLSITEAQISQGGHWILFTVKIANQAQLRLVRIDGQELQTLYCAPAEGGIYSTQLSYDAKHVVFTSGGTPTTYLLDLTNGNIQSELVGTATHGYMARTWLDNQHVYMVGFTPNSDAPTQDISILDISKGSKQNSSQLQKVVIGPHTCDSFDSSFDATQLLLATCTGQGAIPRQVNGPSTISSQPAIGGTSSTLYTSTTQAITTIRAISKNTLLLLVENTAGDKTQNGLWKINMDGTGITRLSSDTSGTESLCPYSQYSWSNVSPDGALYALESYDPATQRYGMGYGSLNGGPFTQFADISDGTQLYLIGWANV